MPPNSGKSAVRMMRWWADEFDRLTYANENGLVEVAMNYFAYGSNMWVPRLRDRVPSCEIVAVARLDRHKLCFHKWSADGSSKCDAFETGSECDSVWGLVFAILPSEKNALDKAEGLGKGYDEKQVDLITSSGEHMVAFTYFATGIAKGLSPYTWYRECVVRGAREHGLPPAYIASSIDPVNARADPDIMRHRRNWPH
jgi:cation transport regulator ChaC